MRLFDEFEAVKFQEENLIFVTKNGFLYYIYNPKYQRWSKHKNAGNDYITVDRYQEVSRSELIDAMQGKFPQKETDILRLCNPSELYIRDILSLLEEDYYYMEDYTIYNTVHNFLLESDICHKSYFELNKLFTNAIALNKNYNLVLNEIVDLSCTILGRDIFKKEIGIVDGHDSSSYFWIKPVRVIDYYDTNEIDNVAEMDSAEISIEEDDVNQYLTPFLYKYFDEELEANKKRIDDYWISEEGKEDIAYESGFVWNLTHNFYTYTSVETIIKDIKDTIDALSLGRKNEFTDKLKEKRGTATYKLVYARDMTQEQIDEYNANRPTVDDTEAELIIDFYQRFIYRIEYMMRIGKEKGYDLISFMGP